MEESNLVPLITNLAQQHRTYIVFAGAGLSIDANVPSGWDILIETLKPLYLAETNVKKLPKNYSLVIDKWYKNHKKYSKMGYSEILELVFKGKAERREYLKEFFINLSPGESHRQLAQMVNNKLIRFIFTTNFDDLIEKALDEIGIKNYDIIYTDDQLNESVSWDKIRTCRIYKLHGDYKTGKIRNTITELKTLEKLISEDFKYIIDRHGIILIGYSGRDEGIMNHFLERDPFPYPFYWQYKRYPKNNTEFSSFHKLVDLYKNKHKIELQLVQNDSASNFLQEINVGVSRHGRPISPSRETKEIYEDYIINSDEKKIRAMTIRNSDKFNRLYSEYIAQEEINPHFVYRYEVFQKYLDEIEFIFQYTEALLRYDVLKETTYFMKKIIRSITNIDLEYTNEFIQHSSPYYILMMFGSLILKYDHQSLIDDFFKFEYKRGNGNYVNLMNNISYMKEGWVHIGSESYNKTYLSARYQAIEQNILPKNVTVEDYNRFDSYVIIYSLTEFGSLHWYPGSSMYRSAHYADEVFNSYFKDKISNKEDAKNLSTALKSVRNSLGFNMGEGLDSLIEKLDNLFSQ